jgi:hypothetical protein
VGGRAKPERVGAKRNGLRLKYCAAIVWSRGTQKDIREGQSEGNGEFTLALQKYTPVFRARGVSKVYIFFF